MTKKKIIQVPMEEKLLYDLNDMAKKQNKPRAEFIREACVKYIAETREEELDRQYIEGYKRIPEDTSWAEAQEKILGEVWPRESWEDAP